MNASQRIRQTVGRLFERPPQDTEIAPPELGGLRLVVPHGYEGFYSDGYEPDVARALARLVKPGDVCADLGAHIGYFALLMASRSGEEGRVVAFEASEENAGYIARTAELNGDRIRLELRHAAVTDGATATIELYPGRGGGAMEWTISQEFAEREDATPTARLPVVVPTVRLDDAFGPGDRLDVVKMDIEGGEGVALAGAERVLAEQRPVFVVEFHREVGWPAVERLTAAGYHLESLDGERVPTPEDPAAVPYQFVASPN